MNLDRWRWRTSTIQGVTLESSNEFEAEKPLIAGNAEVKPPRMLTRAMRSLSISSVDSIAALSTKSSSSVRPLQKTPSLTGSIMERIQRRVAKKTVPHDCPPPYVASSKEFSSSYAAMELCHFGPLSSLSPNPKDHGAYLVLSDQCLVKFGSNEAARFAFPQLCRVSGTQILDTFHGYGSFVFERIDLEGPRLHIPLPSIISVFSVESPTGRAGIEVWWFRRWPLVGFCKTQWHFPLAQDRDEWLRSIQRACGARIRKDGPTSLIPENISKRIYKEVRGVEGHSSDMAPPLIFMVAKRTSGVPRKSTSKSSSKSVGKSSTTTHKRSASGSLPEACDLPSFYFVIGPCMCHLIEVGNAEPLTPSNNIRIETVSFGTVTITRLRATVVTQDQKFTIAFRPPFNNEHRLDLASAQYRRIIEALKKVDRLLKPTWPQSSQSAIFEIKGLASQLHLPSGNDLGGLEKSLQAYCIAYRAPIPKWKIEWNVSPQPVFRLLPPQAFEPAYVPMQLLAVFRALRYNNFFKALSFRDVDLSSLTGKADGETGGADVLARKSLNGLTISALHLKELTHGSVLEQEVHALAFTSESIRAIDMTDVLGRQDASIKRQYLQLSITSAAFNIKSSGSDDILRPLLMLWRQQVCCCHSITMAGTPISLTYADEFASMLLTGYVRLKKIDFSNCALGDNGLLRLWTGLPAVAHSLQWLDTSNNRVVVRFELIRGTLRSFRHLKKLRIAGNVRYVTDESLFDEEALAGWKLQELDLSGIPINDATVDVFAKYLGTVNSQGLELIKLNQCGLNSAQIARLFSGMGQNRRVVVHLDGSCLDEGLGDLCRSIACGYAPWVLFLQMVEFASEANYVKLIRALTVNKTIECLSLAGTAVPGSASGATCMLVVELLAKNDTLRFLDISGFDSRLDEGRLGPRFSQALAGLRSNTRLEHLRVKSQMLGRHPHDLFDALANNKKLRTLDCIGNDLSLHDMQLIAEVLQGNFSLCRLNAFAESDLMRTIYRALQHGVTKAAPVRRLSVLSRLKPERMHSIPHESAIQRLRKEWDGVVADLQGLLERNQREAQLRDSYSYHGSFHANQVDAGRELLLCTAFGELAQLDLETRRAKAPRSPFNPQAHFTSDKGSIMSAD